MGEHGSLAPGHTGPSPTEKGRAAYFRIQGPTVIIEHAPQSIGGDPANHGTRYQ